MDVIYANASGVDDGVLMHYTMDAEIGDGNTFAVQTSTDDSPLVDMKYIYSEGTEYGGIISTTKVDTDKGIYTFSGETWRGILADYILEPDASDDYLTVTGDANTLLGTLITRIGLDANFEAETTSSGITITSFQFERYVDANTGINKMLSDNGAKLILRWNSGKIKLSAELIVDYSDGNELDSDQADFIIESTSRNYNHVIGLGSGDLSARTVIHRYLDENGDITTTQYYTGIDEKVLKYDYANAESEAELIENASQYLLDSAISDKLEMETNDIEADIGDKVTGHDVVTGISITQYVTKKIITISDNIVTINYEIGDSIL